MFGCVVLVRGEFVLFSTCPFFVSLALEAIHSCMKCHLGSTDSCSVDIHVDLLLFDTHEFLLEYL